LIIRGELVNPPTSISCFRDLTLAASIFLHYNVIVEVFPKDPYYVYLKRTGAMDYVEDILLPGEEVGIRVDKDFIYSPTACVVDSINAYNLKIILQSIGLVGNR